MAKNKGFSIIEIVIVIAILAIIGLLGWRVWDANYNQNRTQDTNTQTDQNAEDIQTPADLDKASTSLDNTDIDGDYGQQLDAQTDF